MDNTINNVLLIYAEDAQNRGANKAFENRLQVLNDLISLAKLPIQLHLEKSPKKLTQKMRQKLSEKYAKPLFVLDEKQKLSLLIDGMSVAPEWQTLQRRIVTAGRKNELILQACKVNEHTQVLDATAGFGHDSLLLASGAAHVTMLERNPLMTLMLLNEQQRLSEHKNWQKLMSRLCVLFGDASDYMTLLLKDKDKQLDVVYLDPMFPENSYDDAQTGKGAKVGKHMQALHHISYPPNIIEENRLLSVSLTLLKDNGRVVVKRPVDAPYLANHEADQSWHNNVIRYDAYFKAEHS